MDRKTEVAIQSAQTVSVLRAVAAAEKDPSVRGGDYLAAHFLNPKYRWLIRLVPHRLVKRVIHYSAPGSYGFMIARTRHFDLTLLGEIRNGVRQLVILGAGYDTRPFRFADRLQDVRIFEVDYPGTQAYKLQKLKGVGKEPLHGITFIPLDFNTTPFDQALVRNGFDPGLKTLFLWEGVSYYPPESVVRQVMAFVSSCAGGSSILFDYATRDFVGGDVSTYGGKQLAAWLKKIREPFLFGMNEDETEGFVRSCGLSLLSDYGPNEVERMYLGRNKGRMPGKTLGHVRMAHAMVSSH